ncbi:unnamed protein product [Meganyctiphanes norvegica]|uniref:Transmembrane protein n=1 Tax=Meganyctiphanes norvegica TaxID=48144 RepID=A0AAV2S053_MEGNR
MLKMSVIFFSLVLLLCSGVMAVEEIISENHIDAGQFSDDAADGRACGSCGGVTVTPPTTTVTKPSLDWLALLGALPVLALHVLGLVLLGVLLVHLLGKKGNDAPATDPYYYSGQSYADPGYGKRSSPSSTWSLGDIRNSPVVAFLTQVVSEAIDKHNAIGEH